jgi:hypothetical protein
VLIDETPDGIHADEAFDVEMYFGLWQRGEKRAQSLVLRIKRTGYGFCHQPTFSSRWHRTTLIQY